MKIAGLIVTFNRKDLLVKTINSMLGQSLKPDTIFIVDNASTDGTDKILDEFSDKYPNIEIIKLSDNLGGSGGFYNGIKYIYDRNSYDWIWLMDDDALPSVNALESLFEFYNLRQEKEKNKIGVLQNKRILDMKEFDKINGEKCLLKAKRKSIGTFVGYLIKTKIVGRIGFPEKDFFIYSDDAEYTYRVKKMGYKVLEIEGSYIYHPTWSNTFDYTFKKKKLGLPLWKIYYIYRNPFLMFRNNEFIKFFLKIYFRFDMFLWRFVNKEIIPFAKKGLYDGIHGIEGKTISPGQKKI